MAVKVKYNPMGMTPTPKVPSTPIVKPPVRGPMVPPPLNAPTERRNFAPTPNDRPKVNYNPAPKPIVAGEPNPSPKPPSQRVPVPNPSPTRPPPGPLNPGPMKPPEPPTRAKVNKIRRHETTQERIDRLQAMRKAGSRNPNLDARIKALKVRKRAGEDKPKDKPGPTPVQLDDQPGTWPDAAHKRRNRNTSEKLAEFAPPRGRDTIFYDNEPGDKQNKTAENQKQKMARSEAEQKQTPPPTTVKDNKNASKNASKNDTRQNEDLADRRARLQAALAKLKPTDPKYAQLQARIKNLTKRINKGDTTGRNKNQPGTPQRPYRTHEVTYKPMGYGGTLRI